MNRIKVINEGFVPFVTKEEDEIMIRNTYHENGRREGLAEGMEKGKTEGIKEGIKESALNMLKENIDIKVISKVTGLEIEEIKALKNN